MGSVEGSGSGRRRVRPRPAAAAVAASVLGLALLVGLYTKGRLVDSSWLMLAAWVVPVGVLAHAWAARRGGALPLRPVAPLIALAVFAGLYLLSTTVRHRFSRAGIVRFLAWTALATPLFLLPLRRLWVGLVLLLAAVQFNAATHFLELADGRVLYRTDHPSFLFRLWQFGETWPALANYVPQWNGGVIDAAGVTTGAHGPGLLMWPLLQFLPPHLFYNAALLAIFVVLVPWVAAGSVRAMGGDRAAAAVAGLLAFGVSQHFFLWMLHFGTIGSALSSAMALPAAALAFRAVWLGRRERWVAAGLVASGFLLLLWPAGGVAAAALGVSFLASARRWSRPAWRFLALCALAVAVLYARRLAVLLTASRDVLGYVVANPATAAAAAAAGAAPGDLLRAGLAGGARRLAAHLQQVHPLILFFGLAGAVAAGRRPLRRWFVPALLVLLAVGAWFCEWSPRSQFDRLILPACFLAVGPAAILVSRLLRRPDPRLAVVRAGLCVLLALGAVSIVRVYERDGPAPWSVAPPELDALVRDLVAETPPDGRILFAGKCVHAYGRGNVAYLPALAGREMMAGDYYGFPPGTAEYNYPPHPFRDSFAGQQAFFDAYNVTHVLAYHDAWKKAFRAHPEYFREVSTRRFLDLEATLYRLARSGTLFRRGSGSVRAGFNRIDVRLDRPQDEVVLAYNWAEGLRAAPPVELFPAPGPNGLVFVGARPNGATAFRISFRAPLRAGANRLGPYPPAAGTGR